MKLSASVSAAEFSGLAVHSYSSPPKGSQIFRWVRQNFLGDPTNGFFASAYHSLRSKQLVVAYRGTGDLRDWGFQGNIGNGFGITGSALNWNSQLNTALAYFDACRSIYNPSGIAVCGHSLGGFLAGMVAMKRGVLGVTFDRPPFLLSALQLAPGKIPTGGRLVSFRGKGDPVSATQDEFGLWITLELKTIQNIVGGRGRVTLEHSMDELHEAILLHRKSDKAPEEWR
jgi:pimeloyl-ACP methyl ester carboxylesterase